MLFTQKSARLWEGVEGTLQCVDRTRARVHFFVCFIFVERWKAVHCIFYTHRKGARLLEGVEGTLPCVDRAQVRVHFFVFSWNDVFWWSNRDHS